MFDDSLPLVYNGLIEAVLLLYITLLFPLPTCVGVAGIRLRITLAMMPLVFANDDTLSINAMWEDARLSSKYNSTAGCNRFSVRSCCLHFIFDLTYCGLVTNICVSEPTTLLGNDRPVGNYHLDYGRILIRQWIGKISIKIQANHFKNLHLAVSSATWCTFSIKPLDMWFTNVTFFIYISKYHTRGPTYNADAADKQRTSFRLINQHDTLILFARILMDV